MKLLTYKGVPLATGATILKSLLDVATSYSLSLLVVTDSKQLLTNALLVLSLYLAHSISLYFSLLLSAKARANLTRTLAQELDYHFSQISFKSYHQKNYGEHQSLYINDIPKVIDLTLTRFLSQIEKLTTALFTFISLVSIHYSMGFLALLAFLVMSQIPKLFNKQLSHYITGMQTSKATYTSQIRELLQGFTTFFEHQSFPLFFKKSAQATKAYTDYSLKTEGFTAMMSAVLTFVNALVTALALVILAYLAVLGQVKPGSLLAVSSLIPSFGSSVMTFLSERQFYQSGLDLFESNFSFAQGWIQPQELAQLTSEQNPKLTEPIQTLATTNLHFAFEPPLLFPNLTFEKGHKYAIMGESGSGKSTLLKVLLGEIEDYQGQVLINEKPKPASANLFNQIAYVNQETFLFNDSIRNNIDLAGQLNDLAIQNLLDQVGLSQFSPATIIEENGKNLSGGQRQRLALARALARKKEFLVLDEATANLDAQTSTLIEDLVLNLNQTVIMITHQLSQKTSDAIDDVITLH